MHKDYYTYVHRRNDTGEVFYVGKGRKTRAYQTRSRNEYWRNIVAKHGRTVEIVAAGLTEDDAHRQERRLIKLYSREHLANLSDGGEGFSGVNLRKPKSEMHKANIRAYLLGRKRGPMSEAQKEKIRQANKGRKHSAEHIRKQIASQSKPICGSGGVKFPSLRVAVEWLRANGYPKASEGMVSTVCTGKREMAYGRMWWYV